ncbi:uncharacterized protein TNCV_4646621 [Trichonephila clavipes]|uniref:Uncharacterized protein n=1 Tax=Trichonephila clavipes TaxID=2585209 RepID=A0A8X6T627_TRICX|nr:uncharacterized protein TNCV_4646621 [Trichonephila clavipes]
MRRILYNSILLHNPRCSRLRRIDEADNSTPVEVDQRTSNCLEEAVRSSSRADVTFPCPLPFLRVVRCSSVTASKLVALWNCSCKHELSYCVIRKSSFSMADNRPPLKLRKLLEFLLISSWRHT